MNDNGGSADIYDSPLDLANANDPRTLALRLIAPGKTVLELGPATGRVTRVLSEWGCQVVAVERDGAMAPNLEPYCSRVIVGDVERLSLKEVFGEQRFEVVLAGDFLEHLAHPLKLLKDLKPYLSEDGYMVASIPNIAHGSVRLSLLNGKFEYKDVGILDRTHLRFFTLDSILRLFADAGFAIVEVQRVRQDPFKEPYMDLPQVDQPELAPELKRLIEDDPDAATVQFVVKAFPVNSLAAQLQVLLTLQSQIQEKEKTVFHLEKTLENQRGQMAKTIEDLRGALHERDKTVSDLNLQADGARRIATQVQTALRERERAIRELQARNEMLTVWLTKYKNAKEKLLPIGSLRDRVARRLAGSLLTKSAPASKPHSEPEPTVESRDSVPDLDLDAVIDPPDEWLADPKHPPVVIAIPNWNRAELLRPCIESVLSNTEYDRYRICVYEQGSNDSSREYLVSLGTRVDVIFSAKNVGFVAANNAIIQRYPKWDVVFLNNDTQVTKGWLEALVETACSTANIGLVGCKLVYPSGSLQEAGSQIFQDGSARAYGKYEDQWNSQFNELREVDYCSAACLYAKRKLLDAAGGFDERYSPAYYEDSDLAFAARAEGFKVLYQPRSVVIHHEYGTSGQTAADRMESNRQKFVEKWSAALCRQRRNLWEAVSVTGRDKVLVIHDLLPGPDLSSGGRRLYELVRLLARHYHVVLAYLHPHQVREYLKPLERYGITAFYPGYAKAVHNPNLDIKAILENNEFEYVFCELYTVAEQYLDLVRSCSPASKIIVDTFDVHFLREMRKAELLNDPELRERARQTQQRELDVYRRADMILTVTSADKEAVLQKDARIQVRVVPNIHSLPQRVVGRQERKDVLFVGGFSHEPNVDAMLYFCSEIFPLVQAHLPDIKLHIVGNAPPVEIIALASDHIFVEGHVMNLGPYLESALVSIAPLRYGSGMKGKVGEAMAYGLPVVTTSIGAEGMNLQGGIHALIADEAGEFADCIRHLHDDRGLWELLAKNGRLRVEQEWSPSAVEGSICEALDSLAAVASVRSA